MDAQGRFMVRMEWGPVGAQAITAPDEDAVVVDVLSFTTTLSVAADLGIDVVPWPRYDESARAVAREHGAVLAVRRADAGPGDVSLSPASFRVVDPRPPRVVLPSPNGSTISALLAERGVRVIGASLRNRRAVAAALSERDRPVTVIAAGERWPDGTLRPAVEDLWGAGAVVRALVDAGRTDLSPEARAACAAFDAVDDVPTALHASTSGAELHDLGYAGDVDVAAELDGGVAVPWLVDGVFTAQTRAAA